MPEALLIWIVLGSFLFGLLCGLVIAYVRGMMRRNLFTFLPLNRHIRVLSGKRKAGSGAGSGAGAQKAGSSSAASAQKAGSKAVENART